MPSGQANALSRLGQKRYNGTLRGFRYWKGTTMNRDVAECLLQPVIAAHFHESRNTLLLVCEPDGSVAYANSAADQLLGLEPDEQSSPMISQIMPESDVQWLRETIEDGINEVIERPLNFLGRANGCMTFDCRLWMVNGKVAILGEQSSEDTEKVYNELMTANNELVVKSRELTRQKRELEHARARLQEALDELETSYWHLKKIQEVLPICMECGKVKTSEADWEDVVEYLQRNALFLSHGYCPDCAEKMRREYGLVEEDSDDAGELS